LLSLAKKMGTVNGFSEVFYKRQGFMEQTKIYYIFHVIEVRVLLIVEQRYNNRRI